MTAEEPERLQAPRLRPAQLAAGVAAVLVAAVVATAFGAVSIPPGRIALALVDHLPLVQLDDGLTRLQHAVVWDIRFPRVALALLVGGMLSVAGAGYQGVFRNPLADPHLLGASAGAGLGATLAIIGRSEVGLGLLDPVPAAAFLGALVAVAATWLVAGLGGGARTPAMLVLAGIAVGAFVGALQTYVQQREIDRIQEVYSWLLGQLVASDWSEVLATAPYAAVTVGALWVHGRALDVLAVGDDEASTLGLAVTRTRVVVILAASLATAAAVAVSGLVAFVGIIVPHTVRLVAGTSYRIVIPLSFLFGAAFLALADLVARSVLAPAELPLGVVTATLGAPFFVVVLRRRARFGW